MEKQSNENYGGILEAPFASLQLPHMPIPESLTNNIDESEDGHTRSVNTQSTPTICVLVVADVDLSSASALAEYALQQKRYGVFDASLIDLCIACGPFCRDDDLDVYRKGRNKNPSSKLANARRKTPFQRKPVNQDIKSSDVDRHSSGNAQSGDWTQTPFFRSNEENAALEGNMTATLSQLESIVCRLLFCPGSSDPLTTFSPAATNQSLLKLNRKQYDRLTPNSRNINHQWLPLAPGLGCGGLFYMDSLSDLLPSRPTTASFLSSLDRKVSSSSSNSQYGYGDEDDDDEDLSEVTDEQMSMRTLEELSHQVTKLGQSGSDYFSTLSRLLYLPARTGANAAASSTEIPWKPARPQSVLVTHYVDSLALTKVDCSTDSTMPWPTNVDSGASSANDRQDFYDSNSHQMCLEIASGSSRSIPAQWIQSPFPADKPDLKANVLLPGSLRERGEFSLVYLGLVEAGDARDTNEKSFEWNVLDITIHRLGEFPEK